MMNDNRQQRRILVAHDLHMLADVLRDLGITSISIDAITSIADEIKAGEPIYATIYKVATNGK